ncbi:hypothetical protein RND71_010706 [Anisodus tanguticus]|uniref:Uncharacterized protein n=1 Tax=Anisodus tanguticus TaxID=243964 RepID=A0AAE1VP17_9SOLA|nr:hypothetical protein RND71_010706 [Anisodus tanguticus]
MAPGGNGRPPGTTGKSPKKKQVSRNLGLLTAPSRAPFGQHSPTEAFAHDPPNVEMLDFKRLIIEVMGSSHGNNLLQKCEVLTDLLRTARERGERPSWITEDIWPELLEYWASPKCQKKSELAKSARASEKGGSVHTGVQSVWELIGEDW